jgi:hypothetical protein
MRVLIEAAKLPDDAAITVLDGALRRADWDGH